MSIRCPCGGGDWTTCCGPIIEGRQAARTAEALMRSRYVAFTRADVEYLQATQTQAVSPQQWEETRAWARSVVWVSLDIVKTAGGTEQDVSGQVEFRAKYFEGHTWCALHEDSHFTRLPSGWHYVRGEPQLESMAVQRNAPCPCGSGRKFKQCHA